MAISTYSFNATLQETDFVRICRENHQARFIIVRTEGVPVLTFVRAYSNEESVLRLEGLRPASKVSVPPLERRQPRTWLIFESDLTRKLAPKVETKVEAYS